MLVFKIDFKTDSDIGNLHGDALSKVVGEIQNKTDIFNIEKLKDKYILLLKIDGKNGSTILIINEMGIENKTLKNINEDFLSYLGINIKKFECSEISLKEFSSIMDLNYKLDNKMVYDIFNILKINSFESRHRGIRFSDNLVDIIKIKNKVFESAKNIFYIDSIVEEIERIYKNKSKKFLAHPIHYSISTDDKDSIKVIINVLVSALYNNKRVLSKRINFVNLDNDKYDYMQYAEMSYELNKGGTVVLELHNYEVEKNYRIPDEKDINLITDLIKKYQHEVLTIVVLGNKNGTLYKTLLEKLPLLCFVEFREESIYYEKAIGYLKNLASRKSIENTDSLLAKLTGKESRYNMRELNNIFEEWYNIYIRENIFINYSTMKQNSYHIQQKIKSDALTTLNEMIGLENVKTTVDEILNYHKAKTIFKNNNLLKEQVQGSHMIFTGNPGTAKTTVARLFSQIMKDAKILTHGHIVEVGRADLVDKYLGGTAPRVKDKFKMAEGGVLFIDEAYSLIEDRGGMYGDEAINTIVQEMENKRDSVIVIFAGYKYEMINFVDRNPGIKSRVSFHINFEDYNYNELLEILKLMIKRESMILDSNAELKLIDIFKRASKIKDFGNGRYVRNIFENAIRKKSSCLTSLSQEDINIDIVRTFIEKDFEEITFAKRDGSLRVGF